MDTILNWRAKLVLVGAALALLGGASCSQAPPPSPILDAGKMVSVMVGRSSRTDVFATLGQPGRTERSMSGETWIYEAKKGEPGSQRLMGGAGAAIGLAGAFVPYLGLVGSGVGLLNTAAGAPRREPDAVSLAVNFGDDGIVRDCTYSSTALPAGVTGAAQGPAKVPGCQRPSPIAGAVPQAR